MSQRQNLYNQRQTELLKKYNSILYVVRNVLTQNEDLLEKYVKQLAAFATEVNQGIYDLSMNSVYIPLYNRLMKIENDMHNDIKNNLGE